MRCLCSYMIAQNFAFLFNDLDLYYRNDDGILEKILSFEL